MNLQQSARIRTAILRWYRKTKRDLPWRSTTDPYEILVSEIMLQQTQVSRVKEKLPIFIKRFADFSALASAPKSEVVCAWKGMGYNNRAIRLNDLAKTIQQKYSGTLPRSIDEMRSLPGIGEYTSHAVACFAFRQHVPVVDVNIKRVFSRVFGKMKEPGETLEHKSVWQIAEKVLPNDAYTWNQALMDLGSVICTARNPKCGECPVSDYCASRKALLKSQLKKTVVPKKASNEPMYAGIPRRFWRGKIVEALRSLDGKRSVTLPVLGKTVKKDFHKRELPWLHDVVTRLEKDGVIKLRGKNDKTRVTLSHE